MIEQGDGTIAKRLSEGMCPRCRTHLPPVDVHGHLQCASCKCVIQDCCQGEQAECLMKGTADGGWPLDRADD